jgi:succinate dehydrogenase/fumarate reductase flavoprotein subunit
MLETRDLAWDQAVDVVVVGSGAAALSTAVTASHSGANVLVLEKASRLGGTTAKSHGCIWICDNVYQRSAGIKDLKADAMRFLARTSRPAQYDPTHPTLGLDPDEFNLLEAFYDNGRDAVAFLEEVGGLKLLHGEGFPDYDSVLPEDIAGFSRTFISGVEILPGAGAIIIEKLAASSTKLGARIVTDHRVDDVIMDGAGRVTGVSVATAGGRRAVRARRGVVFACGGFTHDATRRRNFLNGPALGGCAALTNEGDFHKIAESIGIPLRNMNFAWHAPIPLEAMVKDNPDPGTNSIFTAQGDSMLYLNKYGRRTLNEKDSYHEIARAMFRWDQRRREYADLLQFPIWDQRTTDLFAGTGWGHFIPALEDPRWSEIVTAPTLEGIAAALSERLEKLRPKIGKHTLAEDFAAQARKSIERFNQFAKTGIDEDFGRGSTLISQAFHFATLNPNLSEQTASAKHTMYPLAPNGPYYATILAAGTLDTKGGPRTDRWGRVIDARGQAVPGLYGVGNCVASASAEAYWGAGGTLGPILTYGWLAGRHIGKA